MKYIVTYNDRSPAYFENLETLVDFFWHMGAYIVALKERYCVPYDITADVVQEQIDKLGYAKLYINDIEYCIKEI